MNNFVEDLQIDDNIEGIQFRALIIDDIPQIIQLGAKQYAHHNQPLSIFKVDMEDTLNLMNALDYEKILKQKMSFGAFQNGHLISYALGCDKGIDVSREIELREKIKQIFEVISVLREENTSYEIGECFLIYFLVTEHNLNSKGLGTICFNKACKAGKQHQFKKFFVHAFHPGTKRITEKHFKETKIVAQTQQIYNIPTNIWAITAMF